MDAILTLTSYVCLPVNIEGVHAIVKACLVDNQVYKLLLGIPWMWRVGTVKVILREKNGHNEDTGDAACQTC